MINAWASATEAFWRLLALTHPLAHADEYPDRPLRMIVPFPVGDRGDTLARVAARTLSESMAQPFVVENIIGASGRIAASYVARSKPDGHTLLFTNNAIVANQATGHVSFDVSRDLVPIGVLGVSPIVLAVDRDSPVKSVSQLIDLIAKSPDRYRCSCGTASAQTRLAAELLWQRAGVPMAFVPVDDGAGAANREFPIHFDTYFSVKPVIGQGMLRALGIASETRWPRALEIPTLGETSPALRGVVAEVWYGLLAPAGTPAALIHRLNGELNLALHAAEVERIFEAAQVFAERSASPADMEGRIRAELQNWTKLAPLIPSLELAR